MKNGTGSPFGKATSEKENRFHFSLVLTLFCIGAACLIAQADQVDDAVEAARQKRFPEAIAAFKEALARDPANARAHLLLGDLYLYQQRQYDLALAEFEQAALTGDGPTKGLAHEQAGDILMMVKRDWAQAAAQYRQVLAMWPNHVKTHYNLGGCLANEGHWAAALAEMELVVKLAPKAGDPEMATRAREAMTSIRAKQQTTSTP